MCVCACMCVHVHMCAQTCEHSQLSFLGVFHTAFKNIAIYLFIYLCVAPECMYVYRVCVGPPEGRRGRQIA